MIRIPEPANPPPSARRTSGSTPPSPHSPQFVHEGLSARLGVPVIVKVETVNPIRSFKGRGTWVAVPPWQGRGGSAPTGRSPASRPATSGRASPTRRGRSGSRPSSSRRATPIRGKLERMRALGAEVIEAGEDFDSGPRRVRGVCRRSPGRAPRRRRRSADRDRRGDARARADRRRRRGRPARARRRLDPGRQRRADQRRRLVAARELPGCRIVGVQAEARRGDGHELLGRPRRSTPSRPPPMPTGSRPGWPSRARSS